MIKKAKNSEGEGGDPVAGVDLDFGELFRSLGDLVRLLGRLGEAGETHMERHGEFRIKGLGERATRYTPSITNAWPPWSAILP